MNVELRSLIRFFVLHPPDIEKQNKEELFRIGKYEALAALYWVPGRSQQRP